MAALRFRRILLKLSGQSLAGDGDCGVSASAARQLASEIRAVHKAGVEIGIVVGGGNFIRGTDEAFQSIDRSTADQMGMLATVINALALQNMLENLGAYTRVLTAINMEAIAEPFIRRRAIRHLEKGRIVIFAAGTGNPYFTTDSAAALRAVEIEAEVLLKGTRIDGVYDLDPETHADAERYQALSYMDVVRQQLKVMDSTAVTLCMENQVPIVVFNITEPQNLMRIVRGEKVGTTVGNHG